MASISVHALRVNCALSASERVLSLRMRIQLFQRSMARMYSAHTEFFAGGGMAGESSTRVSDSPGNNSAYCEPRQQRTWRHNQRWKPVKE